jgi:MoaA/NifB/PqqE/SkfB family radical SAM enzyme
MGNKEELNYIRYCLATKEHYLPVSVDIETINRCNGTCSFCPANKHDEKRPYQKMDDALFEKILVELSGLNYSGTVSLFGNNEPFLDARMPEMLKMTRSLLTKAKIHMYTNGILLTKEKLNSVAVYIDCLRINNYSEKYELTESSKMIYEHVRQNESHFRNTEVIIDLRYNGEYLSNRAKSAPNKADSKKIITSTCLLPFSDLNIKPDGTVSLCCCDVFGKNDFGNVKDQSILEIFHGEKFKEIRKMIYPSRSNVAFCKYCDFIEKGGRAKFYNNHGLQFAKD